MVMQKIHRPGLEGVIAAETRLSRVDGLAGELIINGYALEDIAPQATFEEMVYLLWENRLPDAGQLRDFRARLAQKRSIPPVALMVLREAAAQSLSMMDALRAAAGTLSLSVDSADTRAAAATCIAAFPTIIAAYARLLQDAEPIAPDATLSHAANYLYMLDGTVPSDERVRALETYLNAVMDHGFNASTFTARTIISTQSDVISAVVGAMGALKGPLHGGAPGPALDMVFEIGKPANAEPVIRAKLARGERLMGFGHRVYKVRDPRAEVLRHAAEDFFREGEQAQLYALVKHVEEVAVRLLEEHKPGRNLQTNVEFYTALVLHGVGLPSDLFSPTFALARVGGWTAHVLEHQAAGRIIRPLAAYTGDTGRQYAPLEQR